ncbi:hypothetical protein BDZ45DRAFT_674543 [Acephala macrosclerotiorum]|nr:hypothetical protein BDZ45DRAFT_674543 [Acephala macrosclerotiorum]
MQDWLIHKQVCGHYRSFQGPNLRPSSTHKLAILFCTECIKPKFIQMKCFKEYDGSEGADIGELLECKDYMTEAIHVTNRLNAANPTFQRFAFQHTVQLYVREDGENDGSAENQCVQAMMRGAENYTWFRALAVNQVGTSREPDFYRDITCADLRIMADFFRSYGTGREVRGVAMGGEVEAVQRMFPSLGLSSDLISVVDIRSRGDQQLWGMAEFGIAILFSAIPSQRVSQST